MARELQKYGLQLPAFSKIGGILANEMPIDEVLLHACVLAINDAIEKRHLEALMTNLKLIDAHLYNVADEYTAFYLECMLNAKTLKYNASRDRVSKLCYLCIDLYSCNVCCCFFHLHFKAK